MGMSDGPDMDHGKALGITWDTGVAQILGGRWDGHEVEYHGSVVEWKGETYVALRTDSQRVYYLLHSMTAAWFNTA